MSISRRTISLDTLVMLLLLPLKLRLLLLLSGPYNRIKLVYVGLESSQLFLRCLAGRNNPHERF